MAPLSPKRAYPKTGIPGLGFRASGLGFRDAGLYCSLIVTLSRAEYIDNCFTLL